jgi:hypothetical protein
MLDVRNVHPLDHFKRQTAEFRERLKATGQPEVLTVDGRAELVVQDAAAYQDLVRELEQLRRARVEEFRGKVSYGLTQAERGKVVEGSVAVAEVRRHLKAKARRPPRK